MTPIMSEESAMKYISQLSETPEVKEELSRITKHAVDEENAFGAPWIVVELADGRKGRFFGSDRMESIACFMSKPYLGAIPAVKGKM